LGPRKKLIAGNWKMNGSRAKAAAFIEGLEALGPEARPARELLICPPATLVALMADRLAELGVAIGGQDCHSQASGAFTGDIAAAMLADLGCRYVIVGHSERRAFHHETDRLVHGKAIAALAAGLTPIICVGETLAEREAGEAESVIRSQIAGSAPSDLASDRIVVAYEPIWAIGSGRAATLDDIAAMHHIIREAIGAKLLGGAHSETTHDGLILYGGSVKPENASDILALEEVDGALIGGASLEAGDFMAIADCVANESG
jgi:triosephosphate isomerase